MIRRLSTVLLTLFILFAANDSATTDVTQAGATVAWFEFTPRSGMPGTVVHLKGGHFFGTAAHIYVEAPRFTVASSSSDDWLEACEKDASSSPPVATAQPDQYGNWNASITIPSTLPSGQPITTRAICIMAPSDARWSQPFIIISNKLPPSGQNVDLIVSSLTLAGLVLIVLGWWLLDRTDRHVPNEGCNNDI